MGVAVGDYDNDGDPDLYVTALGGGHLFRNDGGQVQRRDRRGRTPAAADGWLTSAAFFDMENDGDLDLFVCRYVDWSPETDRGQDFQLAGTAGRAYGPPTAFDGDVLLLLRNDGGKFTDVSEAAGIRVRTPELKVAGRPSRSASRRTTSTATGWSTWPSPTTRSPNFLFHNLGGGKFEEIGDDVGRRLRPAGSARGAMGIDWADFRNDGSLGLAIGNFANEMTALYVTDDPTTPPVLRPGQPLRPRRPDPAAAEVRPLLLRLRPRRPARPALGQRPPRERHRQGPGERDLRAAGPALLEHRATGRSCSCSSGPRPPAPTCSGRSSAAAAPTPTSTATATSTSC